MQGLVRSPVDFVVAAGADPRAVADYRRTARNFNAIMAAAANVTIAEVENLVKPGEIDPNHVHTPGIFVNRIFKGQRYENPIEKLTVRKREAKV